MTHGDKAKAKAAKSNKASVKKAGPKGGENGKSKAAGQAVQGQGKAVQSAKTSQSAKTGKGSKAAEGAKAGAEKAAGAKKGSGSSQAKDSTSRAEPKAKSSAVPADTAGGFSNPAISAAFRQALKKYPNALRKLTD
jgi:hypothetical protein